MKFASGGYIVNLPNMVCVTTLYLVAYNLDHDLSHIPAKSPVYTSVVIIANFCRIILKRVVLDEYYLFSSDGYALAAR